MLYFHKEKGQKNTNKPLYPGLTMSIASNCFKQPPEIFAKPDFGKLT